MSWKGNMQIGVNYTNGIPGRMIGTNCLDLLVGEPLGSISTDASAGQIGCWIVPTRSIARSYQDDISRVQSHFLILTDSFEILASDWLVSLDPIDTTVSGDIK